ncbi:hypothetical protein PAEPH01_0349 [Pancytospora epiphaga]|nr:hypothetical protein PAEPH01_0349 [Pancytospora epiphaga]
MEEMLEKVRNAFSTGVVGEVYGRKQEREKIEDFLKSDRKVLHIVGRPGTGKTCTVLSTLCGCDHIYVNFFHEPNIGKILKKADVKIVVIDEFDRYFVEKKEEAMRYVIRLGNKGAKLITISNNLRMGNLEFCPYDSKAILSIINLKIKNELGMELIEEPALMYLSKKYGNTGDLRLMFKSILDMFVRKAVSGDLKLGLVDCLPKVIQGNSENRNIQHQIIMETATNGMSLTDAYVLYLEKCGTMGLPIFTRQDFSMVFEMYK